MSGFHVGGFLGAIILLLIGAYVGSKFPSVNLIQRVVG